MLIISVVAAILAGVFINVFPVIYGVRGDERIDEYLKLPSAKEKFENAADTKTKTSKSQESPLVKQAEAFALYLNPAKQTVRKTSKGTKAPNIADKVAVTPKFKVFATIYYPDNPNLSQALIDEPGMGRHWIRQSSMVGHLLLEQVKDGLIVIKGSKETFELEIEKEPQTGSPRKPSSASQLRSSQSSAKSTSSAFSRAAANVRRTRNISQKPQRNINDEEKMGELVDKLKDLRQNPPSDKTNSGLDKEEQEERAARIQELISKFKSTRVSAEEAKKLDNMGEELKGIQKDPNSSGPKADKSKGKVSPPKPDASAEK
ncbi:MAG: hypothetical protein ACYSUX_18615 [Planctomycetota bacterium]